MISVQIDQSNRSVDFFSDNKSNTLIKTPYRIKHYQKGKTVNLSNVYGLFVDVERKRKNGVDGCLYSFVCKDTTQRYSLFINHKKDDGNFNISNLQPLTNRDILYHFLGFVFANASDNLYKATVLKETNSNSDKDIDETEIPDDNIETTSEFDLSFKYDKLPKISTFTDIIKIVDLTKEELPTDIDSMWRIYCIPELFAVYLDTTNTDFMEILDTMTLDEVIEIALRIANCISCNTTKLKNFYCKIFRFIEVSN